MKKKGRKKKKKRGQKPVYIQMVQGHMTGFRTKPQLMTNQEKAQNNASANDVLHNALADDKLQCTISYQPFALMTN